MIREESLGNGEIKEKICIHIALHMLTDSI